VWGGKLARMMIPNHLLVRPLPPEVACSTALGHITPDRVARQTSVYRGGDCCELTLRVRQCSIQSVRVNVAKILHLTSPQNTCMRCQSASFSTLTGKCL
jgi:hypothetical protein